MNNTTEIPVDEIELRTARKEKQKLLIWIPLILLSIGLLAWVAYLGVGLVMRRVDGAGGLIPLPAVDGNSKSYGRNLDIEKSPDLPGRSPEIIGFVGEVKDNQIYIKPFGTEGAPSQEVVLTKDTKIMRDTTFDERAVKDVPEGEVVQQTAEEGSQHELSAASLLSVWGYKRGDRWVADLILYQLPKITQNPDGSSTSEMWVVK